MYSSFRSEMKTYLDMNISQLLSKKKPSTKKLAISFSDHSTYIDDQETGEESNEAPIFTHEIRLQLEEGSLEDLYQKASYFVRFQIGLAMLSMVTAGLLMLDSSK